MKNILLFIGVVLFLGIGMHRAEFFDRLALAISNPSVMFHFMHLIAVALAIITFVVLKLIIIFINKKRVEN